MLAKLVCLVLGHRFDEFDGYRVGLILVCSRCLLTLEWEDDDAEPDPS